jgi:hypothetical protein
MGTNNRNVASDISNSYKYGEGESCKIYILNSRKSSCSLAYSRRVLERVGKEIWRAFNFN